MYTYVILIMEDKVVNYVHDMRMDWMYYKKYTIPVALKPYVPIFLTYV